MSVIAKFKVDKITEYPAQRQIDKTKGSDWSAENTENISTKSIEMSPVYEGDDPKSENTKFWEATPCGSITLDTINPEAWKQFEVGKEYYITFEKAPEDKK